MERIKASFRDVRNNDKEKKKMDGKKGLRIALIAFVICAVLGCVDVVIDIIDKAWVDQMGALAFDVSKTVLWFALSAIFWGKYKNAEG